MDNSFFGRNTPLSFNNWLFKVDFENFASQEPFTVITGREKNSFGRNTVWQSGNMTESLALAHDFCDEAVQRFLGKSETPKTENKHTTSQRIVENRYPGEGA